MDKIDEIANGDNVKPTAQRVGLVICRSPAFQVKEGKINSRPFLLRGNCIGLASGVRVFHGAVRCARCPSELAGFGNAALTIAKTCKLRITLARDLKANVGATSREQKGGKTYQNDVGIPPGRHHNFGNGTTRNGTCRARHGCEGRVATMANSTSDLGWSLELWAIAQGDDFLLGIRKLGYR